jgi:hypothetical protein
MNAMQASERNITVRKDSAVKRKRPTDWRNCCNGTSKITHNNQHKKRRKAAHGLNMEK